MKTWIRRSLVAVAGIAIVLGGLAACSHRSDHRHGNWSEERVAEWRGKAVDRVSSQLQLDAEQQRKLGRLADEMLAARKDFRGPAAAAADPRSELKTLIAGPSFDRSKALQMLEQKTQAVQGRSPTLIAALADFYDSLNPAQQAQVRAFMEQRRGWRRG